MTAIVWLRQDLRTEDNPALFEASKRYETVIPLYIWSPEEEGEWAPGAASKWWIHHSLNSLAQDLEKIGLHLTIRSGASQEVLESLINETGASAVFWNRRYEPASIKRDTKIKGELSVDVESFNGSLLWEPWTICNKTGEPYKVFTPFYRACLADKDPEKPLPIPKPKKGKRLPTLTVDELNLLPGIHWDSSFYDTWDVSTAAAKKRMKWFAGGPASNYQKDRDFPALDSTSSLSPYLHHGNISARMIWHSTDAEPFLRQLGWREFAHHLLYHFPKTPKEPLRPEFSQFPWKRNKKQLEAWQQGRTGYPFVDAGMRELWKIGTMHNRLRMMVGSFLVKDLLISWTEGAKWFWDTLCDADLANNTLGWQWVGGCGADAAPYFRVFNPITQSEKFDPGGEYIREWVPELADLPDEWIHKPWEAPEEVLADAGVVLGDTYPFPIVDHAVARVEALEAFKKL